MDQEKISKLTPAMQQYMITKKNFSDCIIFYRMGDFYELFFEDAIDAAKILNITLTRKAQKNSKDIPMCGIPFHSSCHYLQKLVKNGFKVAICEQIETPEQAKKRGPKSVIQREVVRIITPGTIFEDNLLEQKEQNFIMVISLNNKNLGLSWIDISTNSFFYSNTTASNLESDLAQISPKEIVLDEKIYSIQEAANSLQKQKNTMITKHSSSFFEFNRSQQKILSFFKINNINGIGDFSKEEICACGAAIEYLEYTQPKTRMKLNYPKKYSENNFMQIDATARESLNINSSKHGLINKLDFTITGGGGRMIRQYINMPLSDHIAINNRLDIVEFYLENKEIRHKIRNSLKNFPDIDRCMSRISLNKSEPVDMINLLHSLNISLELSAILEDHRKNNHIIEAYTKLGTHGEIIELLSKALVLDPKKSKKDGGFINPDFDPKLSKTIDIKSNSNKMLLELRDFYRKSTGIVNLKISSNNLIGYYVEVSSQNILNNEEFIHKQSLLNSVRYTTKKLLTLERDIMGAQSQALELETRIFEEINKTISKHEEQISLMSQVVAQLDVHTSLASCAEQYGYNRPKVDDSKKLVIESGRHPIVELNSDFVPNDIHLDENTMVYMLTGPNMAGKSTFLRQNAIIALMSHFGSFVPAQRAHIGTIDRILSRVGASDNIAEGKSTFMVEMIETASITNNATDKSLVILDEVGRGTALYDGISIAISIVEYIHNVNRCRAIFSTHYHQLCELEKRLKKLKCYSMQVQEWDDDIVFMHKIRRGSTNKSYGIHIAKMAGMNKEITNRATTLLEQLSKIA